MPKKKTTIKSARKNQRVNKKNNKKDNNAPSDKKPAPNDKIRKAKILPLTMKPPVPDYLGISGRQAWDRATEMLIKARVLRAGDLDMLEVLCGWYDVRRSIMIDMTNPARTFKERADLRVELGRADARILVMSRNFGLTPIARENSVQFGWTNEANRGVTQAPIQESRPNPFKVFDKNPS